MVYIIEDCILIKTYEFKKKNREKADQGILNKVYERAALIIKCEAEAADLAMRLLIATSLLSLSTS